MKILFDLSDNRNKLALEYFLKKGANAMNINDGKLVAGDIGVFSPAKKWQREEVDVLPDNITIFAGAVSEELARIFKGKSIKYINYLDDEIFAICNANLTAEGVLSILIKETDNSIFEQKILIIGVGRIGKALAILLGKLGIDLTLGSFSDKDKINGNYYLCKTLTKGAFLNHLSEFDVIINTIPNKVFSDSDVQNINQKTVVIETASVQCLDYKENCRFKYVLAPKLPSIYSLKSASKLVISKIEEVLDD